MRVLVLGGTGATGRLVVNQLIKRNISTRVVIRNSAKIPKELEKHPLLEIITGNITEFSELEIGSIVQDCDAVVSCLGHNISFKGMFGNPRNLVSDSIKAICEVIQKNAQEKVKLVLMSTTGFTNTFSGEVNSIGEKIILSLLKLLLPPHRDNMKAATYLIKEIGNDNEKISWVSVRPDSLIDAEEESPYTVHSSPIRSPLFDAGKTSRINVSHFMAELLVGEELWEKWDHQTPVIYNT